MTGAADDMRGRLLAGLARRGLLADGGCATVYGEPAWRPVEPGHEPQALMAATELQRRLVACAYGTAAAGADQCAAWVERVFARPGVGVVAGDAVRLYGDYCHLVDTRDLRVGMIVAVARHPYGAGGWDFGHVGIYVGDGMVMDCVDARVREVPLELWLSAYGVASQPRWGWLGAISLA